MDGRITAFAERTSPWATRLSILLFMHNRDNLNTYEAVVEAVAEERYAIVIFGACSLLICAVCDLTITVQVRAQVKWQISSRQCGRATPGPVSIFLFVCV